MIAPTPDCGDHAPAATTSSTADPLRNRVLEGILATARRKLAERDIDVGEPFPAMLVRELIPGPRMCTEAIHRAIGRGRLQACKVGRAWFTDWAAFVAWISRRTLGGVPPGAGVDARDAEAVSRRVERRLARR